MFSIVLQQSVSFGGGDLMILQKEQQMVITKPQGRNAS